jgi:hypothetical protein
VILGFTSLDAKKDYGGIISLPGYYANWVTGVPLMKTDINTFSVNHIKQNLLQKYCTIKYK